jgi:ribonuclease HII
LKRQPHPLLLHEQRAWADGFARLAGLDEVGRGPLAGPVVAAAVFIDRAALLDAAQGRLSGLTDSKQLSAARRGIFYDVLTRDPGVRYGLGRAGVAEIDRLNILRATHLAMARACEALGDAADCLLVDGLPVPALPVAARFIVGGDGESLLIAAASVIAKVTRDREMANLDRAFPAYGFARHKGYGTAEHLEAIARHGPSPHHRRSFRPVRQQELALGMAGPPAPGSPAESPARRPACRPS